MHVYSDLMNVLDEWNVFLYTIFNADEWVSQKCHSVVFLSCGCCFAEKYWHLTVVLYNQPTDWQADRPTKEVTNHRLCVYTVEDVLMNTTFVKCVVKSKEAFIILIVHLNMKCNVCVCGGSLTSDKHITTTCHQHTTPIPSTNQHISIECISNRIEC